MHVAISDEGRHWASYPGIESLGFEEFFSRIAVASEENSMHQEATVKSKEEMRADRNAENCFRFVELGIPNFADVIVVGRPSYQAMIPGKSKGGINIGEISKQEACMLVLSPPCDKLSGADIDDPLFQFRILKGHTIESLRSHCAGSIRVYYGFAVIGATTIIYGTILIAKGIEVSFV